MVKMDTGGETGYSLIITEDGQYSLVSGDARGSVDETSGLTEGTQVFLEGDGGVEIVYIVQPESGDASSIGYNLEPVDGSGEANSNVITVLEQETSYLGDGNTVQEVNDIQEILVAPQNSDNINKVEEVGTEKEEEIDILFFCQYCGQNLQTYNELKVHLKEEHDDDADDECEPDPVDSAVESLFPTCNICGSTFVDELDLAEHKQKCDPEYAAQTVVEIKDVSSIIEKENDTPEFDKHVCQLCGARFQAREHLDAHFEKRHGDQEDETGASRLYHKCPYCPKVYMSKWHKRSMVKHIKDEHKGQPWDVLFDVVECDETIKGRRMNATNGPYNNSHPCLYCNRKFLWQKSLARHYKDMHQDKLDTLEEAVLSKLLGNKTKRSIIVFGDGGNLSCDKCGKLFLWRKNLESHIEECNGSKQDSVEGSESLRPKLGEGLLLKCLFCDLVTKYACSMRKHLTRFHANEIDGIDVRSLNIPVVDRRTHGHNLISMDRRQTDERLKDLPVIFKCKFCDYVTGGQSNLKRHLMSIKHGITEEQLKEIKLSSFKVIQKTKPRYSRGRGKKSDTGNLIHGTDNINSEEDAIGEKANQDIASIDGTQAEKADGTLIDEDFILNTEELNATVEDLSENNSEKPDNIHRSDVEFLKNNSTSMNKVYTSKQGLVTSVNDELERSVSEKNENILCPVCDGIFDDFSSFVDHASDHINLKIDFACKYCENSFPFFESLKKHHDKDHLGLKFQETRVNSLTVEEVKGKQNRVKAFECPYCDLILSQSLPLKQHIADNHETNVMSISIKTEAELPMNMNAVLSGYKCGFCELNYRSVEDIVYHMQRIHPFADKTALGRGVCDSGSVRKSGRKRKTNFRILDVEEAEVVPFKKTKLDYRSQVYPRTVTARVKKSEMKKSTTKESSNKVKTSDDNVDTSTKVPTQTDSVEECIASNKTDQKNDLQPNMLNTGTNQGLQPVVVLDKSVITDSLKTEEKEKVMKKKVGRKRKEAKVETIKEVSPQVKNKIDVDLTTGNKCPYCDFSCKRSSALTFHINFNHAKIKEEPIDEFTYSESSSTHNIYSFGINREPAQYNREVGEHTYKHVKEIIAQGSRFKDIKARIADATNKSPYTNIVEMLDGTVKVKDELDEFEVLDDSDVDKNYKPSGDECEDDDQDDDGDDDDDFLDEIEASQAAESGSGQLMNDTDLNDLQTGVKQISKVVKEEPNSRSGTKWKCVICQFICKTKEGLKRHVTRCHPSFRGIGGGAIEINTDTEANSCNEFKCPYCKYLCQHKNSLLRHVKTVHPVRFKQFNVDSAVHVVDKEKWKKKLGIAPLDGHFYCPFCGIINKWKKSIVRHIRTAHPTMPPDTEILPVLIDDKKVNKDKQRFNIGYKKFLKCLHCSFSCKGFKEMKTHVKRMHDVRQDQLNYQFMYQKSDDQNDLYVNKGQGETGHFVCPFCKLEYSWKKSLHLHIKRRHKQFLQTYEALDKVVTIIDETIGPKTTSRKPKGIRCGLCSVVCSGHVALRTHSMKKHGLKKRPYMKNKLFKVSGLWRQMKVNQGYRYPVLACQVCGRQCKGSQALKVHHAVYHTEKRFTRKIAQQKHIHVHTDPEQSLQDIDNSIQLKCEVCNKYFGSSLELKDHITNDHLFWKPKRKPFEYKCKACSKSFDTQNLRDFHFQTEHIELTEICDICGGVFSSKKKLKQHLKVHTNHPVESTIMCDFCGKTMHKKSMQKHLLFKHTETLLCNCSTCSNPEPVHTSRNKCELCNKSFCQKLTLYAHKRIHHQAEEKFFNCKICTASFPTQKMRNIHLHEKHHSAKPVHNIDDTENNTMEIWRSLKEKDQTTHVITLGQDKGTQYLPKLSESSLSAVIKELVVMSNDKNAPKPFKCLLCGKSFSRSKYIKLHIRRNHVKDEDKPYRCKVCGSGFVRLTEFRKHSRAHSGFRPFKCKVCGKAFKQQANLKDHMHIHKESKDFQCFICKREFQQRGGMMSHILTHDTIKPFKCMYCEKGFTTRGELSRHMQRYSSQLADSKSFLCHICQTTFPHFPMLLRHIESHNPEKPFLCEACGGKFGSFTSLYNHKLKQNHFLLSDIQLADNVVDEKENIDAQAVLEINLYQDDKAEFSNDNQALEQTIFISQDGFGSIVDPNNPKTTIVMEPQSEEIVHTTHKLHENEELLSIAKQLTELSTYTENYSTMETVMNDENEIIKDMLDADTEVLAHVDKQTVKQRLVIETPKRKIPETIEEILQIQHIHQQQEDLIIKEDDGFIVNEEVGDFLEEELELEETVTHQDEQTIIDEPDVKQTDLAEANLEVSIDSKAPVSAPTNMEELAAFIAQNQIQDQGTNQITAYEMGDGTIYVCMPEPTENTSYETVIDNAVQSITDETSHIQQETEKSYADEPAIENDGHPNVKTLEENTQVIHVDINKLPETAEKLTGGIMQISVPETANSDFLQQETLNMYNDQDNSVIELANDERTFIKQEMLDENFSYEPVRTTMENGVFTFHDIKLRYEVTLGNYKCLECGKMLGIKKRLKDHMKRHLPAEYREYVCMFCNNRFVTQNELNRHLTTHTDDRRFKCTHCGKSFRQTGHLAEHLLIHQGVRPFKCSNCDMSFRTKHQLVVHNQNKHQKAKFNCDECDRTFKTRVNLLVHKGSAHSKTFKPGQRGKKPKGGTESGHHQCHKCGKAFSSKYSLNQHLKAHDGILKTEKKFMCEFCGNSYSTKEYVLEHISIEHSDKASEICEKCGEAFKTLKQLREHTRRKHSNNVSVTRHVKVKHQCVVCSKKFSTRHALAYHIGASPECKVMP